MLRKPSTTSINKEEFLSLDSKKHQVKENTKYSVSTKITGKKGLSYCGYFAAIMFDSKSRELGRQIRWITDFTEAPIEYKLVFTTKPTTKFIILSYRINIETPVKSNIEIELEELSSLKLVESPNENHVFDDISKYTIPPFPPLSSEEENILEKRMVWLFSPPRSGTTWLGTQLLNHPENIIWHEPWLGFHLGVLRGGLTPAKDFDDVSPDGAGRMPDKKSKEELNLPNYKFERIYDMNAENGQYFFSSYHKNNWLPFLRKLILARTFSHAQTLTKNIIIKDPVSSNGTDIMSECLPNCKILFLIRDGRDEVDSRIDMHKPNSWAKLKPFLTEKDRLQGIKYYSQLWVVNTKNIKRGFENHNSKLKLMVKYENLVKDTFSELKRIYDFLNVEISDNEIRKIISLHEFKNIPQSEKGSGQFNRSAKPGGWKDNFSPKEQELLNSIMEQTLQEFGYEA